MTTIGKDMNPKPEEYAVEIAFGRTAHIHTMDGTNMAHYSKEDIFTHYKIVIVDTNGKEVGSPDDNTGIVAVVKSMTEEDASCCSPYAYSTTVTGKKWPEGGVKFMILPHEEWKVGNKTMTFTMPSGEMSTAFTDKKTGTATRIPMRPVLKMTLAAAQELVASPRAKEIAKKAVYESLKAKGVLLKNIIVKSVSIKTSRRLGESRRLASHLNTQVVIDSEILIPEESKVVVDDLTADAIDTTAMTTALVEAATEAGLTKVTANDLSVDVEETKKSFVQESIAELPAPVTGAARPMAGTIFSAVSALAMAFAGQQLLA